MGRKERNHRIRLKTEDCVTENEEELRLVIEEF